ncbi:trichodiene oxygenase [Coccidioides immitis RMSCC 3703]|uniref:Trichodiene oxygenase n=1 Tax=Coccidioides immitis RMSCC 3703 TaxID=454286 RepID=A0A0J8R678_COCIT|nr:trichodiene oxygenase [Coccidioides immitis RMSCC 3703]
MALQHWYHSCSETHREGVIAAALAIWILYLVSLAVYRLYFSPLAKFPGPKLAALTRWYEAYYEIVKIGQYSFKVDELHDKFGGDMNIQLIFVTGPIVRVTPDERNPPPASRGLESYVRAASIQIYLRTTSLIISHRFSRRAILVLEPVVREYVALLCKRVAEYATKSKPLAITVAHSAYTGDVIVEYSFGFSYRHLENPNFESFHDALMVMGLSAHLASQFSWFLPLVNSLPDWFVEKIQPDPASLLRLRRDHWDLIGQIIRGEEAVSKVKLHPTIFHEILRSSLPPEEKSQQRLLDEAQIVVAAGYGKWTIPANTTITMSIVDVHHDEAISPIRTHSSLSGGWIIPKHQMELP